MRTRDISTITATEGRGLWDHIMPKQHKGVEAIGYIYEATEQLPKRVVFHSGVERLGITFEGKIWADSDLIKLELDQEKIIQYLLSIGIVIKNPKYRYVKSKHK